MTFKDQDLAQGRLASGDHFSPLLHPTHQPPIGLSQVWRESWSCSLLPQGIINPCFSAVSGRSIKRLKS